MNTFFEAVLNGWWQGIVLTLLVWLVMRELHRVNAATRAAIWQVTLLVVLLLPGLQRIHLPSRTSATVPAVERKSVLTPRTVAVAASEAAAVSKPVVEIPSEQGPDVLIGVSLALALLQLLRLAFGYASVRKLKRKGRELDIAMPARQTRPVSILSSESIAMPMAVGYLRPAILLPHELVERLTPEEMHYVLLHELAHLSRRDDWMTLVERVIRAIFFFQPAVHFIGRQIDREREMACDDWVVAKSGESKPYASALARLAELGSSARAPMLATGAGRRKQIFARLETLLDRTRNRLPSISEPVLIIASIGLILAVTQGAKFNRLFGFSHFSTTWIESDGTNRREFQRRGEIDFSENDEDVSTMSPGAMLVAEKSDGWHKQRLEFEADDEGTIQRRYFSGSMQRPFDDEARHFAAAVLPQWVREQGHDVPVHVARAIRDKGVDGALDDIRTIHNNDVKRQNLEELLKQADLNTDQLQRVLKVASRMDGNDERMKFLETAGDRFANRGLDGQVLGYIDTLQSDDARCKLLIGFIERGAMSDITESRLLRSVGEISSEDTKSLLLVRLAEIPKRRLPEAFFDVVDGLTSNDKRLLVLSAVLKAHGDEAETTARVLRTSDSMPEDERAKVLRAAAEPIRAAAQVVSESAEVERRAMRITREQQRVVKELAPGR